MLQAVGRRRTELSLSLIGDAEMRELNRSYRRKDRPTDVLAFPLHDPPVPDEVACLGDVVISIETARVAARQQRRPLATLSRCVVDSRRPAPARLRSRDFRGRGAPHGSPRARGPRPDRGDGDAGACRCPGARHGHGSPCCRAPASFSLRPSARVTTNGGPPRSAPAPFGADGELDGRTAAVLAAISGARAGAGVSHHRLGSGRLDRHGAAPVCRPRPRPACGVPHRLGGGLRVLPRDALLAGAHHRHLHQPLASRQCRSVAVALRFPGARLRDLRRRVRAGTARRHRARAGGSAALGRARVGADLHPGRISLGQPGILAVPGDVPHPVRRADRRVRAVGSGRAGERGRVRGGPAVARR